MPDNDPSMTEATSPARSVLDRTRSPRELRFPASASAGRQPPASLLPQLSLHWRAVQFQYQFLVMLLVQSMCNRQLYLSRSLRLNLRLSVTYLIVLVLVYVYMCT